MTPAERTAQETRELILATAEAHLRRYGYARTTVSEIARACGMSHANVYRFFKTKAEVIDAVIEQWLAGIEQSLREIAKQPTSSAERLKTYVLELHRLKRAQLSADPELFEALVAILEADREVIERHLQALRSILADILNSGVQTGEFQISDIRQAAEAVGAATLKFHHPITIKESIHEPTEEQACTVVNLLTTALAAGCI